MEYKEKKAYINRMMELIMNSSHGMPDYVFHYFVYNKIDMKTKPFYNLIADSFLTLYAFCKLMRESAWSQAFALLRVGIEQVSAVFIMSYIPDSLDKYLELLTKRYEYAKLKSKEQQKQYCKDNGIQSNKVNDYFDYGWVAEFTNDNSFGRKQMIELAKLDEFNVDIDETLNSFAHGSISVFQMSKDNWKLMRDYGNRACLTCCKLYDYLCCSYHNLIGNSEFTKLPLNNSFAIFKQIWHILFVKEGWIKNNC